jgi:hypothetical protein
MLQWDLNINSLFIFVLFILPNLLSSIVSPEFKKMLSEPSYARHAAAIVLMYFAITVTGTYGSMSAWHILISSFVLYAFFNALMQMKPKLIFTAIMLLFCTYALETQKQFYKSKDKFAFATNIKQMLNIQTIFFACLIATMIYGLVSSQI